jgi:hypothetical protein
LTLAKENQTSFEEYLSNNPNVDPGIDLTVTVLTTGFWPSYKSFDLNLPAEMVYLYIYLLPFFFFYIYPELICQMFDSILS